MVLSSATSARDPLATALRRKTEWALPGVAQGQTIAAGAGWRVVDVVCTSGPEDRPFEERHDWSSVSLVLAGSFVYRSAQGTSLMSPGAMMLGNAGEAFECGHEHAEGDRCLSFQFEPALFERLAQDVGAARATFGHDRVPPLRALASVTARAQAALAREDSFEEIAFALAGAALRLAGTGRRTVPAARLRDPAPVVRVLRDLESRFAEPHPLADLARTAGQSRYHFLRTFTRITGVTPHQWLLRARLRAAAERLAADRAPVTEVALDVGFEDLSNFIRSFRAEFGVSPGRYRASA
jgi:AraC family transcriptional regulator